MEATIEKFNAEMLRLAQRPTSAEDEMSIDSPRLHTIRRTTKMEWLLGGLGITQFVAVVWFFARLSFGMEQVNASVTKLEAKMDDYAVLRYRIEQLERIPPAKRP